MHIVQSIVLLLLLLLPAALQSDLGKDKLWTAIIGEVLGDELADEDEGYRTSRILELIELAIDTNDKELYVDQEFIRVHDSFLVVDSLLDRFGYDNTSCHFLLQKAVYYNRVTIAKVLVAHGADIHMQHKTPLCYAFTLLDIAVGSGSYEAAEWLLKMGIGSSLANGVTPLHVAAHQSDRRMVELLLKRSSWDVNARSADGYTPLHMLATNSETPTSLSEKLGVHDQTCVNRVTNRKPTPREVDVRGTVKALLGAGADWAAEGRKVKDKVKGMKLTRF
jgi:Ankyrin repeats (3 copies)